MTSSTRDIEDEIYLKTGIPSPPHAKGKTFAWPGHHYLIKDWLDSIGVPDDKIRVMSNGGLERTYSAGEAWVRKTLLQEFKPPPKSQRGRHVPGLDFDKPPGFAPGEILNVLGAPQVKSPDIETTPNPLGEYDVEATARAAENIIAKHLTNAEIRLTAKFLDTEMSLRNSLAGLARDIAIDEVKKLRTQVTNETRERIAEIAIEAAQAETERLINERIPRRLEIILGNEKRVLDAEPRHEAFDRILFWLALKRHVYIVGPHGTGKTHLFKQLAQALGKKYYPIGQTLTKYELSGYKGPTGEYIGTLLRDAIEHGGFVGIDEGDTWAAAAMVFLNTPLANGYCSFPDKVVEVHPDFLCCIAANTWGHGATMQYQGRNPLDAASLDRFAFEEVDYDERLEKQLYGNTPWTQYCHRVRTVARELRIYEAAPSMRALDMGNQALDARGDPELIQKSILWKGLAPDTVAKIKSQAGTFGTKRPDLHEVA